MAAGVMTAKRILVVDDERAVASELARALEAEGAVCTESHAGPDAAEKLAGGNFDLMLCDVEMPGRSGLELLDDARALTDPPAVIVMAEQGEAAEALTRGADGWLKKPVSVAHVVHEAILVSELRRLTKLSEGASQGAAGTVLAIVGEIVNAFEKADPYRAGYSSRTARLAVQLAAPLGLDMDKLALAARVHDVGMLAVPVTEQHTEGPPDRITQHLIRVHPTLGARWIERLGADRSIVAAVAAHHERWDGGGYPGGLRGEDIPPFARALGTAAAIAAMSATRPWREKRESVDVIAQLESGRGKQFGVAEADAAMEILLKNPALVG